jgi:hypothetical protein
MRATGSMTAAVELEYLREWRRLSLETAQLLRRQDELMEKRVSLVLRRRQLFRDLAAQARAFNSRIQDGGQRD